MLLGKHSEERDGGIGLECEEVRRILKKSMKDLVAEEGALAGYEATQHLLHCDSCFKWSMEETEKIRKEKEGKEHAKD